MCTMVHVVLRVGAPLPAGSGSDFAILSPPAHAAASTCMSHAFQFPCSISRHLLSYIRNVPKNLIRWDCFVYLPSQIATKLLRGAETIMMTRRFRPWTNACISGSETGHRRCARRGYSVRHRGGRDEYTRSPMHYEFHLSAQVMSLCMCKGCQRENGLKLCKCEVH